jgi:hypothetical protein
MARKPTGNPVGPPPKKVDWTLFEQLCAVQCTQTEIASMLKISVESLRSKSKANYGEEYCVIYKRYSETGKCSLRRNQFVMSAKNATMAIWLGKQWLGQKDLPHSEEEFGGELKEFVGYLKEKYKKEASAPVAKEEKKVK